MGMNERKYIGAFLRIETGEKGWRYDRCRHGDECPNDISKHCSLCGELLSERYETHTQPFPNPDDVLIELYDESLLSVLSLHRPGRYTIFAISNRAFGVDQGTDEEDGDDGRVREITGVEMTSEESEFAQEFSSEIGALHLAGAKVSVHWGEIIYWN